MELRSLRYFIAVAEELHFGRAAARLHMTQPPLSQAIRALEDELGAPLFSRSSRNVELSAAGVALLPEARRILQQCQELPLLARRAAEGESGSLSMAFVSIADYSVLPNLLRRFRKRHAQVQIDLREATSDLQFEELAAGRIDLGFLIPPLPDRLQSQLDYQPLLSEPLVLALPQGVRDIPTRGPVSLTQLRDWPLVIFPRRIAPAFHDAILACFTEAGLAPQIGQEAIQMQTIVGLVSAGLGMALVPQSVSNLKRPGVVYRRLRESAPLIETGVAWRRDNASPVLRAFLSLIANT